MRYLLAGALAAATLAIAAPVASLVVPSPAPDLLGPICGAERPLTIAGPHRLVMLSGMGHDAMAADTANPEAQRWFDYGLTLARSFEHRDATLAFQRARALDPHCSLCTWGEAWSRGPTINFPAEPAEVPTLLIMAKAAKAAAAPGVSARIKGLEAALVDRYGAASAHDGDLAFAHDMDALHSADPNDIELAIFDAEAWMVMGSDPGNAAKAVAALQPLVPRHPDHSGLVHFYIHATENAGEPQLALAYAERLGELAPMASHMVHMPSHTYFRVGRYEDAALANVTALKTDEIYAQKTSFPTPLADLTYHFHDVLFGLAGAMMAGDARAGMTIVRQFDRDFPSPATYDGRTAQAAGEVYMALGRFAPTRTVLDAPDTAAPHSFVEAMRHYARGEAYLRLGRAADVRAEAALVAAPSVPPASRNGAVLQIAQLTLLGEAAMLDHHPDEAAGDFRRAAAVQAAQLAGSWDPPAWWYPVGRSLAAALLAKGDAAGAKREADAVLATWKLDPLTLALRAHAEAMLRQPSAGADLAAARRAWHGDPRELNAATI